MRRTRAVVAVAVAAVVTALLPVGIADAAPGRPSLHFPAHHTVRSGEWLWSIARDFLGRVRDDFHQRGGRPSERAVAHEVAQIRMLNRDQLDGHPDQVYPGQRLLLAQSIWDVPDGRAGWSTGFSWCVNRPPPARTRPPAAGLTLRMHLDRAPLVAGHRATKVELVIRNASDGTVRLTSQLEKVHLVDRDGRAAAVIYTDAVGVAQLELAPGAVQRLTTWVMPFACGDVPMLDRVLKPGRYRVTGSLRWGRRHDSGRWSTREREVRVVRR